MPHNIAKLANNDPIKCVIPSKTSVDPLYAARAYTMKNHRDTSLKNMGGPHMQLAITKPVHDPNGPEYFGIS